MRAFPLILSAFLVACSQQATPPAPLPPGLPAALGITNVTHPQPERPKELPEWEKVGMSEADYWELDAALEEDELPKAKKLYRRGKMPLTIFVDKCLTRHAGRCFRWALSQGYKVQTTRNYWEGMLTDWCCDVDEEEADKMRHVLIPLLKANRELLKREYISPVIIYLAQYGCKRTMRQVLALGAPAEVTDERGRSALDYAHFYGYAEVEKALRTHGAKRLTVLTTAERVWEEEIRRAEALRKQADEEYEARLKAHKPGEPLPIKCVVPEPIHRPHLP